MSEKQTLEYEIPSPGSPPPPTHWSLVALYLLIVFFPILLLALIGLITLIAALNG
jgi:hypothetical protein